MPSATVADSRLSSPASAATATAEGRREGTAARSRNASEGAGSSLGSAPIRAMSRPGGLGEERRERHADQGERHGGQELRARAAQRGRPRSASATAGQLGMVDETGDRAPRAQTCSRCPPSTPSAVGSCCRAMTTAIPAVNPSITGIGSSRTSPPTRANASTTRITPASSPTVRTPLAPNRCTTGMRTTVIAPVGPDTCRLLRRTRRRGPRRRPR